MIERWIRNNFGFSRSETYGTIILFFFIGIMIISTPLYEMYLVKKGLPLNVILLDSLVQVNEPQEQDTIFYFDPNTISQEQLQLLGMPQYLAIRFQKFRNAGGRFNKVEDVYGIYGLDSQWVQKVSPYIRFNKSKEFSPKKRSSKRTTQVQSEKKDINLADTTSLKEVRGIGSVLSKRIIKFRDKLGGFVSLDQLSEVYGISPELAEKIKTSFYLEGDFVPKKIEINFCTIENLASHPYLNYKIAEMIINFRDQHYPVKSAVELLPIPQLDSVILKKINPYLSFRH